MDVREQLAVLGSFGSATMWVSNPGHQACLSMTSSVEPSPGLRIQLLFKVDSYTYWKNTCYSPILKKVGLDMVVHTIIVLRSQRLVGLCEFENSLNYID